MKKNRKNSVKIADLPVKTTSIKKKEEESNSDSDKNDEDYE